MSSTLRRGCDSQCERTFPLVHPTPAIGGHHCHRPVSSPEIAYTVATEAGDLFGKEGVPDGVEEAEGGLFDEALPAAASGLLRAAGEDYDAGGPVAGLFEAWEGRRGKP